MRHDHPGHGHDHDETDLADLVTRDSMIGVGLARPPALPAHPSTTPAAATAAPPYRSHADLGGQDGHGPVRPEAEGALWHALWEPRALALTLAMGATGAWNIDQSRAARETQPDDAQLSCYRLWLAALTTLMAERGRANAARPGHRAAADRLPLTLSGNSPA